MPQNPLEMLQAIFKDATDRSDFWARKNAEGGLLGDYQEDQLPPHMVYNGPKLPPVARAPMFRPQTEVRGGQNFSNSVENFFKSVPEMRGRARVIQHGPTGDAIRSLGRSDINPTNFGDSSLLGIYGRYSNEIGISPALDNEKGYLDLSNTIAHEMGHAAGLPHGREMDAIEHLERGGDPRLIEPEFKSFDNPWDVYPRISKGPDEPNLPKPLKPEALRADIPSVAFDLIMQLGELNRKRYQGAKHLVNEDANPWK